MNSLYLIIIDEFPQLIRIGYYVYQWYVIPMFLSFSHLSIYIFTKSDSYFIGLLCLLSRAQVLDCDVYAAFEESGDVFDKPVARLFRHPKLMTI